MKSDSLTVHILCFSTFQNYKYETVLLLFIQTLMIYTNH